MNLIPFYKDVISWNDFAGNDINNKKLINLYIDLVKEESTEVFDSIKDNDPVEFLDGVADSLVVGSFLQALVHGDSFEEHTVSSKKGDLNTLIEELKVLVSEPEKKSKEIIFKLEEISNSTDSDILACCQNVMESNWSKFPLITEVNPEDEIKFIESQGRYSGIVFEVKTDSAGSERFIFKSDKGKIVKPSTFKEPTLQQFVTEELNNFFK